jgi:hypothetical protein
MGNNLADAAKAAGTEPSVPYCGICGIPLNAGIPHKHGASNEPSLSPGEASQPHPNAAPFKVSSK